MATHPIRFSGGACARTPFVRRLALAVVAGALLAAVQARAQDASTLTHGIDLLNAQDYEHAAPIFFDVVQNSGQQELQLRAEYYLAVSLFKMGLYHSALYYDNTIVDAGPTHPYYRQAVVNMLDVMDAIGDKSTIPYLLDKYYNDAFARLDQPIIDRINFLVALWDNGARKKEFSAALLKTIKPEAAVYPRALYLRGVQLAQAVRSGDAQANDEAAALFQQVLGLESSDAVTYTDLPRLKELATLALARVRYAQGKFREAHDLDAQIPRYSRLWRDALFEGAYAAFMADDYGQALGMLHTLHAPVAGDQFVPESWLLEGTLYYYDCLFDESRAVLKTLHDIYTDQTLTQLNAILGGHRDLADYYELLMKGSEGDGTLPANVRNELLTDESISARRSYIAELTDEESRLQNIDSWQGSPLPKALLETVSVQRDKLIKVTGTAISRALQQMKASLEDFDGQSDIVKFEMAKREKDLLEGGYDQEKVLAGQTLGRPAQPANTEHWGFDGEYWPDELGYYEYTVKNACPAEPAAALGQ